MVTLQQLIFKLSEFWASRGCLLQQPLDIEVGAGTMHPETFLRVLGPAHWNVAYVQPSRRPADGRFGENPEPAVQAPSVPGDPQAGARRSAAAVSAEPRSRAASTCAQHDIRFEEDNWESPTLGAWGIGWQVLFDGLEITQFTYFQQAGGVDLAPISAELTYGLERIAMALQDVDNVFDLEWAPGVTYRDVRHRDEVEQSKYVFGQVDMPAAELRRASPRPVRQYYGLSQTLLRSGLVLPALEYCLKCSHMFNMLDASGSIGVTERTAYILRVRQLAVAIAKVLGRRGSRRRSDVRSMDRELLIEIGVEELPAGWLPDADEAGRPSVSARGCASSGSRRRAGRNLQHAAPADRARRARSPSARRISTNRSPGRRCPRRSAPTASRRRRRSGFAKKQGVDVRGADARQDRQGRVPRVPQAAARQEPRSTRCPNCSAACCGDLAFPKQMHWDAMLDDGRGELLFGRPIRWLLFLYGGRVVPFTIGRTPRRSRAAGAGRRDRRR